VTGVLVQAVLLIFVMAALLILAQAANIHAATTLQGESAAVWRPCSSWLRPPTYTQPPRCRVSQQPALNIPRRTVCQKLFTVGQWSIKFPLILFISVVDTNPHRSTFVFDGWKQIFIGWIRISRRAQLTYKKKKMKKIS
jgi:hypothetical protein